MKAVLFAFAAVGLAVGTASAATEARLVSYEPISGELAPTTRASNSIVFSAIPGPYQAFAAATGVLGFDDYDSTLAGGNAFLQSLRFVGGLTAAGTIRAEFYDTAANLVSSANLPIAGAGNFIYNFSLETALNAKDSTFLIPEAGFIQLVALGGVTGQFFLSTTVPSVGTSSLALGSTTTHTHRFELTVPAPSAMALLGLGGLVAVRRRR